MITLYYLSSVMWFQGPICISVYDWTSSKPSDVVLSGTNKGFPVIWIEKNGRKIESLC